MAQEWYQIWLPQDMAAALAHIARDEDITPGQVIRDLLTKELNRRHKARPPVRADEQLVAPLRARLAGDFAHCETWEELDQRLKTKGYVLQVAGGGLAVHRWPQGARLCKASDLGFSYARLQERFQAPFPGHPHHWIFEKVKRRPDHDDPDGAMTVVERM